MRTMEEIGNDRIVWDYPPERVRDIKYPGAKLWPLQSTVPKSLRADGRHVQTYYLTNITGHALPSNLTEIP